jgi:hypothetical protein
MSERIKMTVEMEVTFSQALALREMFEYWNQLSSWGGSRMVGFFCDGDGNFHPKCKISTSEPLPERNKEISEMAILEDDNGDRNFDYDAIAWSLHKSND